MLVVLTILWGSGRSSLAIVCCSGSDFSVIFAGAKVCSSHIQMPNQSEMLRESQSNSPSRAPSPKQNNDGGLEKARNCHNAKEIGMQPQGHQTSRSANSIRHVDA